MTFDRPLPRITSYNVCYTKLLRFCRRRWRGRQRSAGAQPLRQVIGIEQADGVVTVREKIDDVEAGVVLFQRKDPFKGGADGIEEDNAIDPAVGDQRHILPGMSRQQLRQFGADPPGRIVKALATSYNFV